MQTITMTQRKTRVPFEFVLAALAVVTGIAIGYWAIPHDGDVESVVRYVPGAIAPGDVTTQKAAQMDAADARYAPEAAVAVRDITPFKQAQLDAAEAWVAAPAFSPASIIRRDVTVEKAAQLDAQDAALGGETFGSDLAVFKARQMEAADSNLVPAAARGVDVTALKLRLMDAQDAR